MQAPPPTHTHTPPPPHTLSSVQAELIRESRADALTVLVSYAAMLVYIALALGSLPPDRHALLHALVLSRASLGESR